MEINLWQLAQFIRNQNKLKKRGMKMNQITVVHEQELLNNTFTIYGTKEEPFFLAKDVASWIGHTDLSRMVGLVEEDEKLKRTLYVSGQNRESIDAEEKLNGTIVHAGQNREMWFLTEDGLYEVLMQSRKPIAKQFKKEVKHILKNIRKHGGHLTDQTIEQALLNPDTLIQLATTIKEEREARMIAEQRVAEYEPKIDYLDMILSSEDTVTTTQIAADYGMSARQLNEILHKLGIQRKVGKQWLLYKAHMNKGFTRSHTNEIPKIDGGVKVVMNTKWTQKGRLFIYNMLKDEGYIPQGFEETKIVVGGNIK